MNDAVPQSEPRPSIACQEFWRHVAPNTAQARSWRHSPARQAWQAGWVHGVPMPHYIGWYPGHTNPRLRPSGELKSWKRGVWK